MKRRYKILLGLSAILAITYAVGPKPKKPYYKKILPKTPIITDLENFVNVKERKFKLKPNNQAEIIWADSSKKATEYAIVYLHGFSASKNEGKPVHFNLAKKLKANLYLSRLSDHGIDTLAPMQNFTATKFWESAQEAYAIGKKLGKKVILVGTSTGGSAALKLAATYPEIYSLILLSPNVAINDKTAWLLNNPWGLQIARKVVGAEERVVENKTSEQKKYWYDHYRLEALVELQEFLETTMLKETFKQVKQPTLLLYYYKNEQEQDPVVKVEAMLNMFNDLGTPTNLKVKTAIPNAGSHVLGCYLTSHDVPAVETAIANFVNQVLKIPKNKNR